MDNDEQSEIESLRAENERLLAMLERDFKLTRLHYEQGKPLEMEVRAAAIGAFAASCRDFLADAKNYVEMVFEDDLGRLAVVIQKLEGETPAQKAARLTKRLELIEAMDTAYPLHEVLQRLADATDHLLGTNSCAAHGYEGIGLARDAARRILVALREGRHGGA